MRKGRKRVNIIQLFKRVRTKLKKRDPYNEYEKPDKEYSFDVPDFILHEE